MAHKIVVKIKPDGKVVLAVQGVAGSSCSNLTRAIEQALGTTTEDKRTPEFFQQSTKAQELRQQGGA